MKTKNTHEKKDMELEISPFIKNIATGTKIPAEIDFKEAYGNRLLKKYR